MWVIAGPGALGRLAELRVKSAPARPSPWWLRAPASQQFSNVASALITPTQWIALSRQIGQVLKERDDIAGVVVTHGTDRLEETAFFLYLTVRSDKPASPSAVGKGVLVVMDGRILSAREVRKAYQRVGGFTTGDMGMLGVMGHHGAEFFFAPARAHGSSSEFDLSGIESLPDVDLLFSYPGGRGPRHDQRPAGIVVANTSFNCEETLAYLKLARRHHRRVRFPERRQCRPQLATRGQRPRARNRAVHEHRQASLGRPLDTADHGPAPDAAESPDPADAGTHAVEIAQLVEEGWSGHAAIASLAEGQNRTERLTAPKSSAPSWVSNSRVRRTWM